MRDITIKVTGRTEMLMHNSRLVNPMDSATKELAAAHAEYKRAKTDEAFYEMAKAEFFGSIYHNETEVNGTVIGPYWSTDAFHACLKNAGAKVVKKGRTTYKNFVAAALLPGLSDQNPLTYRSFQPGRPAPRTLEGLWADENYRDMRPVRVGSSQVIRTRPKFQNWAFDVPFQLDTEVLDLADLERVLVIAGQVVGLGDWRPEKGGRRGRFTAQVTDHGEAKLGIA
jgi:hypothetical protein